MKLNVSNLVLEVTRRCNMSCAHCMRGDAQCKDMTPEVVDKTLQNIEQIGNITFTGGEPTLNVDILNYTLKVVKERRIPVESFYIVTNGKVVAEEFLLACMRWHAYAIECCGGYDEELSGVALSRDIFHDSIPEKNVCLLKTLGCYRPNDKHTDFRKYGVRGIGRGASQTMAPISVCMYQHLPKDFIDSCDEADGSCVVESMTVTVDGTILSDCDYAYDAIDHLQVGSVYDPEWLYKHIKKYHERDIA